MNEVIGKLKVLEAILERSEKNDGLEIVKDLIVEADVKQVIMAKYGTNEKVVISAHYKQVPVIQKILNEKFGGEWIYADDLNAGECIPFSDNTVYKGFHPSFKRYFDGFVNLRDQ